MKVRQLLLVYSIFMVCLECIIILKTLSIQCKAVFVLMLVICVGLTVALTNHANEDPFVTIQKQNHVLPYQLDNFCMYCKYFVNCDTKHCHYCHKCINGFDHHNLLLNKCIGRQNIRYFIFFLFYSRLFIILLLALLLFSYLGTILLVIVYIGSNTLFSFDYDTSQIILRIIITNGIVKVLFFKCFMGFRIYLSCKKIT